MIFIDIYTQLISRSNNRKGPFIIRYREEKTFRDKPNKM